jgi:hypothetical protein
VDRPLGRRGRPRRIARCLPQQRRGESVVDRTGMAAPGDEGRVAVEEVDRPGPEPPDEAASLII